MEQLGLYSMWTVLTDSLMFIYYSYALFKAATHSIIGAMNLELLLVTGNLASLGVLGSASFRLLYSAK